MNTSDDIKREVDNSLVDLESSDVEGMNTSALEHSTSLENVDNVIHQSVTVSAAPRPVTENGGSGGIRTKPRLPENKLKRLGKLEK